MPVDRHHRQTLLPQIGVAGRDRLAAASVLIVGCGALGTVAADYLARAGFGRLVLADRDVVERTNLQRQTLFVAADVDEPKAIAAARRLATIDESLKIEPHVVDVSADNIEKLANVDVIVDGTDNGETRYLVNDLAVRDGKPWVYGACVGTEGRHLAIVPGVTPCLRCLFETPPVPAELPTCDTVGVLGPAAGVIASLQAAAAIRLIVAGNTSNQLITLDAWTGRVRSIDVAAARRPECPCCGQRQFPFLESPMTDAISLCGRDAVQIRPPRHASVDVAAMARRLSRLGSVEQTPYLLRFTDATSHDRLTFFGDGRVIIHGTTDSARARSLAARYIGV